MVIVFILKLLLISCDIATDTYVVVNEDQSIRNISTDTDF